MMFSRIITKQNLAKMFSKNIRPIKFRMFSNIEGKQESNQELIPEEK